MNKPRSFSEPGCVGCEAHLDFGLSRYCAGFKNKKRRKAFRKSDPAYKAPKWCPKRKDPCEYRIYRYTFIDLQSVQGMYDSIRMLGEKYGKQAEANALISEYESVMEQFEQDIVGKEHPSVLVLMGLPGTYIECTPNSYVGSLVELAGATSVVQVDDNMNFVAWNTEELLELDPDIILLTAHGLPDEAMEMFAEEFTTNDIWQHFRAVQEGRVYQLDYNLFGMSCTFDWPEALEVLREILYDGTYEAYV